MNTAQTHLEFSVYLAEEQSGQFIKKQTVGIAYLPHRHVTYHLHLYTFMNESFYILPSKISASKVTLMTRERGKGYFQRYIWHPVGTGEILSSIGVMKLKFDLFGPPIYMSLYPEEHITLPKPQPISISKKENV